MLSPKFIHPMSELALDFKDLVDQINGLFENRGEGEVVPRLSGEVIAGLSQLFTITAKLENTSEASSEIEPGDITQIGEYGFNLFSDLLSWARQKQSQKLEVKTRTMTLSLTQWIIHFNGSIQSLDMIVDSIAFFANKTSDVEELKKVTHFMSNVSRHCDVLIRNDSEQGTTRSWRILLLNCAITATRSHNAELMRRTFDRLIQSLPEDAASFFTQGMQQMDKFDYPEQVRIVMQEYFDRYARPKMN